MGVETVEQRWLEACLNSWHTVAHPVSNLSVSRCQYHSPLLSLNIIHSRPFSPILTHSHPFRASEPGLFHARGAHPQVDARSLETTNVTRGNIGAFTRFSGGSWKLLYNQWVSAALELAPRQLLGVNA